MTLSIRIMSITVLLTGVWLAPTSMAADLETLLKDFRVVPIGLKPAPAFTLKTLEGKSAALAEYRGHAALLYFWATW
jgi:hypothetical protein